MIFYNAKKITLKKNCPMNALKNLILTQIGVRSIRNLRMRIISAIMYFICAMLLPFKYCPMNILINLVEF